jgi:hypothetical protein
MSNFVSSELSMINAAFKKCVRSRNLVRTDVSRLNISNIDICIATGQNTIIYTYIFISVDPTDVYISGTNEVLSIVTISLFSIQLVLNIIRACDGFLSVIAPLCSLIIQITAHSV